MVDQYSIDLLWHAPIEGTQASLDMHHRDVKFTRHQSSGERRISIAIHHHGIGAFLTNNGFERAQHAARHCTVTATMNVETVSWCGNSEFVEKNLRHPRIEMLTCMDQHLLNTGLPKCMTNRCGLHKLGPRPDHRQ